MIDMRPPTSPPPGPPERDAPDPSWTLRPPQLSGPGWLAATGATLLLVAAIVVVAGRWAAIGPTARFAGLVGSLFAVFFAAEASRRRIPTTATALASLAACVTAPVGIAAVAALEARWPVCITVGGGAALIACEVQARRWGLRTLKAATVAATMLLVAGTSVLLGVPAPVLGSITAALALAGGARQRSFALALVVPFVPALWLLAEANVGPGVLRRMGIVSVDDWVIPVSALIAALTVAVAAHIWRRSDVAATALVMIAYATAAALVETIPPPAIWLSVPAAIGALVSLVALGGDRSIFSRWAGEVRSVTAVALAGACFFAPLCIIFLRAFDDPTRPALDGQLIVPAVSTFAAMLLFAATVERTSTLDDIIRLGCIAALVATIAATDTDLGVAAIASLATWIVTTATTSWRAWVATSALHGTWATVAVLGSATASAGASSAVIVLSSGIVILSLLARGDSDVAIALTPIPALTAVGLLALQWPDQTAALAAVVATIAIVATGFAMFRPGFAPADSLALALGSGAAVVALTSTAAAVSLGVTLLATQVWIYGVAFRSTTVAALGAVASALGVASLWWTTGTNDLVIDRIARYGADGQDLALGATALALVGAGVALRRVQRPSTWLAYSPGLAVAFSWLLVAQTSPETGWATFGGLALGTLAVAVGGVRRLAAPLVIGTAGLLGSGMISIGERLAAAPTWTWIAVGGVSLLAIAAGLERSERPIIRLRTIDESKASDEHDDAETIAEVFARTFE